MFTRLLPEFLGLYSVSFSDYSRRNFRKGFTKKYKGRIWEVTERSIVYDLERIQVNLHKTQQVDQLFQNDNYWIFKYDFAVAKSGKSAKASGNRCICFLDNVKKQIVILLIYCKGDLLKNMGEQAFIQQVLETEFGELLAKARN
jgi:hypothetical protein